MARILVAEPSPEVATLLEIVVERLGHEPLRLGRPEAPQPSPDAVVLEPSWEEGRAAVERLSADGSRRPPVVCASVYGRSETAEVPGMVAWLVKPFPLRDLEEALRTALAWRGQRA